MREGIPEIFEVTIRQEGETARVSVHSPAGQSIVGIPLSSLPSPPPIGEEIGRSAARDLGLSRRGRQPEPEDFGRDLFAYLFAGPLGRLLFSSLALAAERRKNLRWVLKVDEAPGFAALPLERLAEGQQCFAIDARTPVVRALSAPASPRPWVDPPFHCLIAAACPPDMETLDLEAEIAAIGKAFAPLVRRGLATVEHQRNVSLSQLGERLRQGRYHLLHFIGHGAVFDDGCLVLEADRKGNPIAERQRIEALLGPHESLRLVVLNCCSSAEADHAKPQSGLAQAISRLDIPAVVGMQSPLTDGAALDFAAAFYGALAGGRPVDVAVNLGRQAVRLENPRQHDWAAPVLFLRDPQGDCRIGPLPPVPPPVLPMRLGAHVADRLLDRPGRSGRALAIALAAVSLLAALVGAWFVGRFVYQGMTEGYTLRGNEILVGLSSLLLAPLFFEAWRGGATQLWRRGAPIAVTWTSLGAVVLFWTFLLRVVGLGQ